MSRESSQNRFAELFSSMVDEVTERGDRGRALRTTA
jgi:hypothetical protein